jgi:hypothetical protein
MASSRETTKGFFFVSADRSEMTNAERILALEAQNRALELDKARLSGEVNGLRAVLDVMRHLLPSASPGVVPTIVPGPWEGSCLHPSAGCAAAPWLPGQVTIVGSLDETKGWKGGASS